MNIITWIGRKILSSLARIPIYEMYSLEIFNEKSKPIIEILKTIPRMEIGAHPYSVIGYGNEFYYVQQAIKRLGTGVFIIVNWKLQDDGWGPPYTVVNIEKVLHFNPDSRTGIGTIGIHSIYPDAIPNIARMVEQVEIHSEEFYQIR